MTDQDEFDSLEPVIEEPVVTEQQKKQHVPLPSITNTAYKPKYQAVALSDPFERGGRACNSCKKVLPHDECLGYWDASYSRFIIVGYFCKSCKDRWVYEKYRKEEKRSATRYHTMSNWERDMIRPSNL